MNGRICDSCVLDTLPRSASISGQQRVVFERKEIAKERSSTAEEWDALAAVHGASMSD
uniref:Uncharacterized protein n=1 Tax=Helianthus annuus TaxID=4232 RepID=A0A251T860_HELAN